MNLQYLITAIPRKDDDARRTKMRKVLPMETENISSGMCRDEIALTDLRPYINWANGESAESFYEFDFVVVLKRSHQHLGFAFVRINKDNTSLNIDMLCASQMGRVVIEGVFILANFLNFEKITLQAVPNVYGFYRKVGFKTISANSEPSPLDKLWDELTGPKEGKALSFTETHLENNMKDFMYLNNKKTTHQSAEHKILRSLFVHKGGAKDSVKGTMREILGAYNQVVEVYDAISEALSSIPGTRHITHVPMEIDMASISKDSLPKFEPTWDLEHYKDHYYNLDEALIDAMGNSSDEEIEDIEGIEGSDSEDIGDTNDGGGAERAERAERAEPSEPDLFCDEDFEDCDPNPNAPVCAPTPTRYRTLAGPGLSCPAEAQILEEGGPCCTSRLEASETHPDSLLFLLALRTVYTSSDSPENIPGELRRTLSWINEYQASNMIREYNADDSVLFLPEKSSWLATVLKFAVMSGCNRTVGVFTGEGVYRELYRKCHDGGACVTLYTDMRAAVKTLNAIRQVGVKRAEVNVLHRLDYFRLPFVNALEVDIVGQESLPVKMEEVMGFILKGSSNSKPVFLTLNRSFISHGAPHEIFAEMMRQLPSTCGFRKIRFATSPIFGESTVQGFHHINIAFEQFLNLVARSLHVANPTPSSTNISISTKSMTYNGFKIQHYENNVIVISQKKKRRVNQYNLDGTLFKSHNGIVAAARAVRDELTQDTAEYRIKRDIAQGGQFRGFRWGYDGEGIQEVTKPLERGRRRGGQKQDTLKVYQYTLGGVLHRTYPSLREASRENNLTYSVLWRKVHDDGELDGFRWSWHKPSYPYDDYYDGYNLTARVSQYTLEGELSKTYATIASAARAVNASPNTLTRTIKDGGELNGFRWAFHGDILRPLSGARRQPRQKRKGILSVKQFTLDGKFIKTWGSMGQVFRSFGYKGNLHSYFKAKIERGEAWRGYRWALEGTPLIMNS